MGGNNPLIVHRFTISTPPAYWTIQSAYITAGQRCSCARRLIVVDGRDAMIFVDHLASMIDRIVVGRYTDTPEPFMGPVISDAAATRLLAAQDALIKQGGRSIVTMKSIGPRSAMLRPGLIDVTDVENRADEEHFGPLLQLIRVKDFDEAIREANRTQFGLTAGLFSDERALWETFYAKIRGRGQLEPRPHRRQRPTSLRRRRLQRQQPPQRAISPPTIAHTRSRRWRWKR